MGHYTFYSGEGGAKTLMTSSKAATEEFYEQYKPLVDALLDKHALEVTVHDLKQQEVSGFTEAFIVAIARSDLHAKTLARHRKRKA